MQLPRVSTDTARASVLLASLLLAACDSESSDPMPDQDAGEDATPDGRGDDGSVVEDGSVDGGGGDAAPDAANDASGDDAGDGGGVGDADADAACPCIHGECVTDPTGAGADAGTMCRCEPRYRGELCDACATGYTGGDCTVCAEGYFGSIADPSVCYPDPCVGDPCNGNGTCRTVSDRRGADVAECTCAPNYTGEYCDECAEGYEGDDCERCENGYVFDDAICVVNGCIDVFCTVHGFCADRDGDGTGQCVCYGGYAGDDCGDCAENFTPQGDACVPDVCLDFACEHGECVDRAGVASCDCDRGYSGTACDECATGFVERTVGLETTCENVLPVLGRRLTAAWDASKLSSLVLDGDRVDRWNQAYDDDAWWSSYGIVAVRPRFILLPPAVQFDGTSRLYSYSFTLRTGDQYAIFAVLTWNADAGTQPLVAGYYTAADDVVYAYRLQALDANTVRFSHRERIDPTTDTVTSTDFDAEAGRQLIVVQRRPFLDGAALSISNGTETTTIEATTGPFTEAPAGLLGHCFNDETCRLRGNVHELLFYEGSLSADEVDAIVAYLREKWSL
jgi:hypothetical protein